MKYRIDVTFTEALLASSPQDPKVYEQFIAARKRSDAEDRGDEVATLPAEEIDMEAMENPERQTGSGKGFPHRRFR